MTPATLARLDMIERAASPAPWYVREINDDMCMSGIGISTRPGADDDSPFPSQAWPEGEIVAACLMQSPPLVVPDDEGWDENATLIAEMRNALPELLRLAKLGLESETASTGG